VHSKSDMIIKPYKKKNRIYWLFFVTILLLPLGCAQHQSQPSESSTWVYKANRSGERIAQKWAPAFVVPDNSDVFNRIGRPTVRQEEDGDEDVFINPDQPVIYFMQRPFSTDKGAYTNLIYRIHFPEVPYSLIPFNLTAGKNVGLIVVVTLNTDHLPILVTTVHTCGCYNAITPTQYLPRDAFPEDWKGESLDVYGERLPPLLNFKEIESPQILVYLRPGVHRVMELEVRDERDLYAPPFQIIPMPIEAMEQLDRLPTSNGTTSLFYPVGALKGHVKGSVKPWETLLLSLVSMDLFVGSDKAYADTGNPFYTSLKPWRRNDSNMWDFARFLHYWGWRL
jgi:hypothetical protein